MSLEARKQPVSGKIPIHSVGSTGFVNPLQRPLIIERPELQSEVQRWGYRALTVMFWVMWMYFFLPLLSVIAWAAGLVLIYQALVQNLVLADFWTMLQLYGSGIGMLLTCYLGYALTGYLRFRNIERRKAQTPVSQQALAQFHNLDAEQLRAMTSWRSHVISGKQLDAMFSRLPEKPEE